VVYLVYRRESKSVSHDLSQATGPGVRSDRHSRLVGERSSGEIEFGAALCYEDVGGAQRAKVLTGSAAWRKCVAIFTDADLARTLAEKLGEKPTVSGMPVRRARDLRDEQEVMRVVIVTADEPLSTEQRAMSDLRLTTL
jgi:hypothetical protein